MEKVEDIVVEEEDVNNPRLISIEVGEKLMTVELVENDATSALLALLSDGALTIPASNYGGFEKVCRLPERLPSDDVQTTTEAGDVMLYSSNQIVIFYGSNSWAYTRLGRVMDKTAVELREILSGSETEITLSIADDDTQNATTLAPTVKLNSGYEIPIIGLGTYSLTGDTCVDSVYTAIKNGYRLIDTAYMYHNEAEVGEAVRKAIEDGLITREDIFITTKLYPGSQYADPEAAIDEALDKLDIGYIDLMLLHHPGENDVQAYKAIEKYIAQGKIRSVGLSNWYIEELTEFLPQVDTVPALVQNEIHPYYQEQEVVPFIQDKGIIVEGWYPLGGRGYQAELLSDPVLQDVADAHGKSVAQVILRWNLQRGVIAIPGSSNPEHIEENIDIFDFELTEEEMDQIAALERNEKHDWY